MRFYLLHDDFDVCGSEILYVNFFQLFSYILECKSSSMKKLIPQGNALPHG